MPNKATSKKLVLVKKLAPMGVWMSKPWASPLRAEVPWNS